MGLQVLDNSITRVLDNLAVTWTGGWRKLTVPDTKIRANHRILKLSASLDAKKIGIQSEAKPTKLLEQAMMVKE